jgi:hypothetical protein
VYKTAPSAATKVKKTMLQSIIRTDSISRSPKHNSIMTFLTVNKRYELDPVKTPGVTHVPNLTEESAEMAGRILTLNSMSHHIYTSDARKMGVCIM